MYKNNFTFSIPGAKENILAGTKVLTIRKLPAKVGKELVLRTGSRWIKTGAPGCLELIFPKGEGPACTGSWPVEITMQTETMYCFRSYFFNEVFNFPESIHYDMGDIEEYWLAPKIAKMDGWNDPEEMIDFFKNTYGLPFDGYINYWG